jgi:hypothetical protein
MRFLAVLSALLATLLLSACAHVRVTTEIKPDGSWTRNLMLGGAAKKEGQPTPAIEDVVVIPSGPAWKSHEEIKDDKRTITLDRAMAAGTSLTGDVSIKADNTGKLNLVNEATVTRTGPHRFEYREALHWKGDRANILGKLKPEDLVKIKASLPTPLATDANAKALADRTAELSIPLLFGPGDPLLTMGLLHPDLAERRASQRIGVLLLSALEQQFGDKLTPAQRKDVARRIIQETFSSANVTTKLAAEAPPGSSPSNNSSLVPLMFVVKTPGRVVSSNGEVDDLTGEVFWGLFSEAAAFKDLTLTAVVEIE